MTRGTDPLRDEALDPAALAELLEAVAPIAPPAALRVRVLGRVKSTSALTEFLTVRAEEAGWKTLAPGIEVKLLVFDEAAGTKSFLLRAQPGVSMPGHDHSTYEECLVLQGQFRMGDLVLNAGDYHRAPAGRRHPEASTDTGVLVYLRAHINDYPGV